MQSYIEKLEEIGKEALDDNKDKIKKAIVDSQIEMISKVPQYIEKLMEMLSEMLPQDSED